jgi:hypothetical protein
MQEPIGNPSMARQSNFFSGDTAISRGIMACENEREGKPGTSNIYEIAVWQTVGARGLQTVNEA